MTQKTTLSRGGGGGGGGGVEICLFACLLVKTRGRIICLNCFVHDCGLKNFRTNKI